MYPNDPKGTFLVQLVPSLYLIERARKTFQQL